VGGGGHGKGPLSRSGRILWGFMGILTTYLTVSADKVNLSASIRYYPLFVAVLGRGEGGQAGPLLGQSGPTKPFPFFLSLSFLLWTSLR
jgi:hypothetical protein